MSALIQGQRYDKPFVDRQTTGIEGLKSALADRTLEYVAAETGLTTGDLQQALDFVANHRPLAHLPPPLGGTPFDREQVLRPEPAVDHRKPRDRRRRLAFLAPKANTLGAWELGAVNPGNPELLAHLGTGKLKGLFLIARIRPVAVVPRIRLSLKASGIFLVVQDLFLSEAAEQAELVLPALPYSEKMGTFMNVERRVQLLRPASRPHRGPSGPGTFCTNSPPGWGPPGRG